MRESLDGAAPVIVPFYVPGVRFVLFCLLRNVKFLCTQASRLLSFVPVPLHLGEVR